LFSWEISRSAFLGILVCEVLFKRGIEFRSEEGKEEIEKIYSKGVADYKLGRVDSGGSQLPIYHPCAMRIRSIKTARRTPNPTHRYVVYGVA
jgi:hypothetical protein